MRRRRPRDGDDRGASELDIATRTTSEGIGGLSAERLGRTHDVLLGHVDSGSVPGLVALVSRNSRNAETEAFLAGHKISRELPASSSLKFCQVACGLADVYPRFAPTCEWDTAAGDAILRAAGGSVRTPDGAALAYGKPGWLNGVFVARGRLE